MSRWAIIMLSFLMCFGFVVPVASASQATVSASFNETTGIVAISGTLGTTADKIVTVQVRNPLNQLVYLDQGKTGANGAYQFNFFLKYRVNGTYFVNVGGEDADKVSGTTFTVAIDDDDDDSSSGTSGGSGSSGSGSAGTITPGNTSEETADGTEVTAVLTVQLDQTTGVASARLDADTLAKAVAAGKSHIILEIPQAEGAQQYQLQVPADLVKSMAGGKLTVVTDFGSVMVPGGMLSGVNLESAEEVGFTVGKADKSSLSDEAASKVGDRPVVTLQVTVDGKAIQLGDSLASVTVSIPYQPAEEELADPEHIVVLALDQGIVETIPSGRYDAASGKVMFRTSHFGTYAVAYVMKSFDDLEPVAWAKKPIEVLAAKGIVSGISETEFNPGANITRADFMVLLTKTFGFRAAIQDNFRDVQPSDYYYEAVGIAKQLGLAEGQGDNQFVPDAQISRQDMIVLLARAMRMSGEWNVNGAESDLAPFADKAQVASYAMNEVAAMVKEGFVEGSDERLNPNGNATRAEAAVLLYRAYNRTVLAAPL